MTGDDLFIIVWRNDHIPMLSGKFFGFILALNPAGTYKHNLCTQSGCSFTFNFGSIARHDDDRLRSHRPRCVGNALGMIPA